jgi:antitoxin HicB
MLEYRVLFEPVEEGGFVVHFPDFTWGVTQGDTEEQALEMAADVVQIYLADCIKNGRPLPVAKAHPGSRYRTVRVPLLVAVKLELYSAFRKAGMPKADFARKLNIPRMNVDRLFDLNHQSRLDQIEAAFAVLGDQLNFEVRKQRGPSGQRLGVRKRVRDKTTA